MWLSGPPAQHSLPELSALTLVASYHSLVEWRLARSRISAANSFHASDC